MWQGLISIYEQRRYQVSFYLATTKSCWTRQWHEWHKLKHQVPQRVLRGSHFFFEIKWPFMFIITCQCTKKWQGSYWREKETLGILSGCTPAACQPAWVQLLWCKCQSGTGANVSHDFIWRRTKFCPAVDRTWKPRCLILIEREPKTTDHFTVSAYRENNFSNLICGAAGFKNGERLIV